MADLGEKDYIDVIEMAVTKLRNSRVIYTIQGMLATAHVHLLAEIAHPRIYN